MRSIRRTLGTMVLAAALCALAAAQPAPARRSGAPDFPAGPAARITSFTAEPTSIQPGQSVTLKWTAVNADEISLDQGIGFVPTRGSRKVSPKTSTIYTLAVAGRVGSDTKTVIVKVAGTALPAETAKANPIEEARNRPIPHMPDGKPDLSGVYIGGFDIRPVGKITVKPGAEKYKITPKEDDLGQGALCVPPGVPAATMQPYPLQIVQKQNLVVILYEAYNLFRVIPIGSNHPADLDPTWMGNSVAKWDGDTLVVDVTGFNDKTEIANFHHTTAYHVVERYRRTAYDTVSYEATIDDPNVFAAPWKYAGNLKLHPEWQIQEYVCEENNKSYKDLFNAK